ncbi:MAG: Kelch repeat-containing protein [Candidatus Hodarchaeales archaeon]
MNCWKKTVNISFILVLFCYLPVTLTLSPPYEISRRTTDLTINSDTWVKLNLSVSPPERGYHEMVYDQESDVVILMDGDHIYGLGGRIGDQWVYSVSANNWWKVNPSERPSEKGAMRGSLAYDSKHDIVIQFGGGGGGQKWNETWVYDYNSNTWTNKTPNVSPPARDAHGMVYDVQSERIIMFGGRNTTNYTAVTERDFLHDVWTYDYATNVWTNVTPSIHPQARWFFNLVYDSKADRVILFGGYTSDYLKGGFSWGVKADTWAFDRESKTWTELTPAISPSPRAYSAMAYDIHADRAILYGGSYGTGGGDYNDILQNDTWVYDYNTNTWTDLNPLNSPGLRMRHTMVYATKSKQMVMFGGQLDTEWNAYNSETWIYPASTSSAPTTTTTTSSTTTTTTTPTRAVIPGWNVLLSLFVILLFRHRRKKS